jgi:nucleotide-binding universal stress UspA family protein
VTGSVLVPLDGSHIAEAALPFASWLVGGLGCPLVLFSVTSPQSGEAPEAESGRTRVALEAAAAPLRTLARDVAIESGQGTPADAIAARAAKPDIGLVVLTTFGRGGDSHHLGSVADRLSRVLTCPALFVNPASDAQAPPPGPILVALDGSKAAESAIEPAVELARGLDRQIVLVRVAPWAGELFAAVTAPTPPSADKDIELGSNTYLAGLVEQLPEGLNADYQTLRGHAANMLIEYGRNQNGVLVLATHGESGSHLWHLGSTTDKILRASWAPVFVVPSGHRGR